MTMSPQDIQAKQFHVRMRGFDMDEVDNFLENIAEEILVVSLENKQLLEKIGTMEKELANYRNKEQTFQSAILAAQRISDEMQAKSRQEAEELLGQAQQEAADLKIGAEAEAKQILEDSKQEQQELTGNINHLIKQKDQVMTDMRQLLNTYLDNIEKGVPAGLNDIEPLPQEEAAEPDLDDLYEKIDLPEQTDEKGLEEQDQPVALDIADIEPLDGEDDENLDSSAPTATEPEGEMLFSLADIQDDAEPSVSIDKDDHTD